MDELDSPSSDLAQDVVSSERVETVETLESSRPVSVISAADGMQALIHVARHLVRDQVMPIEDKQRAMQVILERSFGLFLQEQHQPRPVSPRKKTAKKSPVHVKTQPAVETSNQDARLIGTQASTVINVGPSLFKGKLALLQQQLLKRGRISAQQLETIAGSSGVTQLVANYNKQVARIGFEARLEL